MVNRLMLCKGDGWFEGGLHSLSALVVCISCLNILHFVTLLRSLLVNTYKTIYSVEPYQ